jgi:hypothetical protein
MLWPNADCVSVRKPPRLAAMLAFAWVSSASAATATLYNYTQHFSGGSLSGTTPWATATFADLAANTVQLRLTGSGLQSGQNLDSVYFNTKDIAATSLTFTLVSGPAATIMQGSNAFKADGDGYFDVRLSWGSGVFGSTTASVYNITGPGLTSASFVDLSSPTSSGGTGGSGHGPFYAAGKITSLSGGSAWVAAAGPVAAAPEPEIYAMMLVGFGLMGFVARRRGKRQGTVA